MLSLYGWSLDFDEPIWFKMVGCSLTLIMICFDDFENPIYWKNIEDVSLLSAIMVFKMILFSVAIVGDGTNVTVIFLFEIV